MGWKEKGAVDGREGKQYEKPEKDWIDLIGLGLSEKQVKQNQKDYEDGYTKIGTPQRLADSNKK